MFKVIIPQLGGIVADAWLSEEHSRELEITENPIEFGAPITDHAFVKPQELTIEFGITNTPLLVNDAFGQLGEDRVNNAREMLFALQDGKVFLTVQTLTGGDYERLLLQSISWRTDSSNTQSATFALKLKEVKITATKEVQYSPSAKEKRVSKQISKTKKSGEKPSKQLDPNNKNATLTDKSKSKSAQQQKPRYA